MRAPTFGILEWFHLGDRDHVERSLRTLKRLHVKHLRTGFSWADYLGPGGQEWFDWLVPRLAKEVEVVPCFLYTPPSLGVEPRSNAPPRNTKDYADFLDVAIDRYGDHFRWVELWNEPNNRAEWDWTLDPSWDRFCAMIGGAAYWAKQRGKKVLLGGMSPLDPNWLDLLFQRGVMKYVDAVGMHGFPGTWEPVWDGWRTEVGRVRTVMDRHSHRGGIWISETGFSTWRHDELGQLQLLLEAQRQAVDRVYYYALEDLHHDRAANTGFHQDEREYHFGIYHSTGQPKLLGQLLERGGLAAALEAYWLTQPVEPSEGEGVAVITGGAGFVGTNLAHRLLREGREVLLYDSLARLGSYDNLRWLRQEHGERLRFVIGDLRDHLALREALQGASAVFHLAAQVAVTTSLEDPLRDFEVNARGTMNLLEELRRLEEPPPLVFTSTNKVYGALPQVGVRPEGVRVVPEEQGLAARGISEETPLDLYSPYGCSKGVADQYVLDYARSYGLPAAVFRMSCIYGPHQHGNEDQGWVSHFMLRALRRQPLTLYGDGRQVRDVLHVDDLVDAFLAAEQRMGQVRGKAFNLGGGPDNTLSLLELVEWLTDRLGRKPELSFGPTRIGDQPWYVSNVTRAREALGWRPRIPVGTGLSRVFAWHRAHSLKEPLLGVEA